MNYFICIVCLAAVVGCGQANHSPSPKSQKLTVEERKAALVEQFSRGSIKPAMLMRLDQEMKQTRESIKSMRNGLTTNQTAQDREVAEADLEFSVGYYKYLEDRHDVIRKCKDPQSNSTQRELLALEIELQKARIRHLEWRQSRDQAEVSPLPANRVVLENLEARLKDMTSETTEPR